MSSKAKSIIILLLLCVLIAVIPLTMSKNKGSEFAVQMAKQKLPSQKSTQIMKHGFPDSGATGGETESLLFCLQAGLGAGVFGYLLGVLRERAKHESKAESQPAK